MKLRLCSLLITHCVACYVCRLVDKCVRKGGVGVKNPLELDILQKLYYKGIV